MLHRLDEVGRKVFPVHETEEGDVGVKAGDDSVCLVLSAVGKRYAAGPAILGQDS